MKTNIIHRFRAMPPGQKAVAVVFSPLILIAAIFLGGMFAIAYVINTAGELLDIDLGID